MNFSTITLSHFENPKNVGRILGGSNVVHSLFGSPESHFVVTFDLQLNGDIIEDAKFKAYGGVNVIAGASFLTSYLIGKNIVDVRRTVDINFVVQSLQWGAADMPIAMSLVAALHKAL